MSGGDVVWDGMRQLSASPIESARGETVGGRDAKAATAFLY